MYSPMPRYARKTPAKEEPPMTPTQEVTPCFQQGRGPHADTYINLHVFRANGELVVEDKVHYYQYVEDYLDRLDDRELVPEEPSEEIDELPQMVYVEWSGETWEMEKDGFVDELVWGDMILYWNRTFGYYVETLGMSLSEPVDVIIVRQSRMTFYAASRAN